MVINERIDNGDILGDPKFIEGFRIGLSTYNVDSGIELVWHMKEFKKRKQHSFRGNKHSIKRSLRNWQTLMPT